MPLTDFHLHRPVHFVQHEDNLSGLNHRRLDGQPIHAPTLPRGLTQNCEFLVHCHELKNIVGGGRRRNSALISWPTSTIIICEATDNQPDGEVHDRCYGGLLSTES